MRTSETPFAPSSSLRSHLQLTRRLMALLIACLLFSPTAACASLQSAQAPAESKSDFAVIEGIFHDGLGTFAEIILANELIAQAHLSQAPFDVTASRAKMQ